MDNFQWVSSQSVDRPMVVRVASPWWGWTQTSIRRDVAAEQRACCNVSAFNCGMVHLFFFVSSVNCQRSNSCVIPGGACRRLVGASAGVVNEFSELNASMYLIRRARKKAHCEWPTWSSMRCPGRVRDERRRTTIIDLEYWVSFIRTQHLALDE